MISSPQPPSFGEFAAFVREFAGIGSNTPIERATRFEKDLGITGDDGCDLLEAIERRFGVQLGTGSDGLCKTFNLKPNEYLFHSEGFDLFGLITGSLGSTVREFTAGELYDGLSRCWQKPGGDLAASAGAESG